MVLVFYGLWESDVLFTTWLTACVTRLFEWSASILKCIILRTLWQSNSIQLVDISFAIPTNTSTCAASWVLQGQQNNLSSSRSWQPCNVWVSASWISWLDLLYPLVALASCPSCLALLLLQKGQASRIELSRKSVSMVVCFQPRNCSALQAEFQQTAMLPDLAWARICHFWTDCLLWAKLAARATVSNHTAGEASNAIQSLSQVDQRRVVARCRSAESQAWIASHELCEYWFPESACASWRTMQDTSKMCVCVCVWTPPS